MKVTIYVQTDWSFGGPQKIEARLHEITTIKFAQYRSAIRVRCTPKRKRRIREFHVASQKCFLIVLEGWGHPDPQSPWQPAEVTTGGATVQRGRYTMCDPRWESDLSASLDAYIAHSDPQILADFRGHDAHLPIVSRETSKINTAVSGDLGG